MTIIIGLCLQYPEDVLKMIYSAAKTIKRSFWFNFYVV